MTIRLCKCCGEPVEMTDENVAEANAICKAEFGVPMGHPDLVVVCEDCYNDRNPDRSVKFGSESQIRCDSLNSI